jgi:tetratricopeptide (TPR) repeat protein
MSKFIIRSSALAGMAAVAIACGGDESKAPNSPVDVIDSGAPADFVPVPAASDTAPEPAAPAPEQHAELSPDAKSAYADGFKSWTAGDLATAKAKFLEATKKDPKSATAFYSLGCVLERMGDNAGAQAAYKGAVGAKSDYVLAMGAYAISLARTGNTGEATSFLTDKRAKIPNSAPLANYLAEVRSLAKDSAGAQQAAQDALRIDSNFKDAMVTIARDHHRSGREDLAKYALTAVLDGFGQSNPARDPDNAEAHLLRGLIERSAGQRIAAMKDFEFARAKRPDLIEALIQIGAMKLESGDATGAQPLLEAAVRYAPNQALGHSNLGDCYRLQGRLAEAKKEFDTALAQDATLSAAHYAMGLMYLNAASYPGMSATDQVGAAIRELNTYKQMRGPKAAPGVSDDIDDLITRANKKKEDLNPAPAAPAASAPPKKK